MMARAKNSPMSYNDIVEQETNRKAGNRMFSKNANDNDARLADLIQDSVDELEGAEKNIDTISLTDTEVIKKRTMVYVKACSSAGALPTFSGLLRSFGMSRNAGYAFMSRHPNHATSRWLEMYQDYCADLLANAALRGLSHPIFAIFILKSRFQWDDKVVIETRQQTSPWNEGSEMTPEQIAEKYSFLIDAEDGDNFMLPD